MMYQYFPHDPSDHRDVSHWRGAKGGMRVLSLPSCQGWLRRQANDASYDFWPDLLIGTALVRERRASPAPLPRSQSVFLMQKDAAGDWAVGPWQPGAPPAQRPQAANAAVPGTAADATPPSPERVGASASASASASADSVVLSFTIEVSRSA